jgi:menaquinone-dependent protoporphyrinogen IX oxidase
MRVAVVFFSGTRGNRIADIAAGLVSAIEREGHHVDLIDGDRNVNTKLTPYGYIAVGAEGISLFGGKIRPRIREFLAAGGMVGGKKSFAFTAPKIFGAHKVLRSIMNAMEHEGMFVRYSQVIRSRTEAAAVAKKLKLDH